MCLLPWTLLLLAMGHQLRLLLEFLITNPPQIVIVLLCHSCKSTVKAHAIRSCAGLHAGACHLLVSGLAKAISSLLGAPMPSAVFGSKCLHVAAPPFVRVLMTVTSIIKHM